MNILKKILHRIYFYFYKFKILRILIQIISYFLRKITIKDIHINLLTNIENISEMNIPISWFSENKNNGISGVARIKNGDDFLEDVIESHIIFLDEIIIVDNLSTDNTKNICDKLILKYPDKIKYYLYPYDVYGAGNSGIKSNSIHSLAYYYNWSFSKANYRYVMKIDDDNLFLEEQGLKIRRDLLCKPTNRFINFYGINLFRKKSIIGIPSLDIQSGGYGDIGIYPISKKTYFIQGEYYEIFQSNLLFKDAGLCYFHLKYLKKDLGLGNYKGTHIEKEILRKLNTSKIIPFDKFMTQSTEKTLDLKIKQLGQKFQ